VINLKKKKLPQHIRIMLAVVVVFVIILVVRASGHLIDSIASYQTVKMYTEIRLAFYLYQDRYKKVPGDDDLLTQHGEPWDVLIDKRMAGNADGIINYFSTPFSESSLVWSHLRAAALIPGQITDMTPPRTTSGVFITILTTSIDGTPSTYLCARNMNNNIAQRVFEIFSTRGLFILSTEMFSANDMIDDDTRFTQLVQQNNTHALCTIFF
jgi:hypothetical protein